MPTLIYSGSISEATGLNSSPVVQLTGAGSASGLLNSVKARLNFSTNAYGTYYNVTATLHYTGGTKASTRSVKMDSTNYRNGQFDFAFDGLTIEQANNITAVAVTCSNSASQIFLKGDQSIVVDYLPLSKAQAPTAAELSAASASPGAQVTLRWSGAAAGQNNAIAGYRIYRAESEYGVYMPLSTVSSTATSGSAIVTAPTTNGAAYYYKVQTLGTISGYDSDLTSEAVELVCSYASVGAPTSVTVDVTNVAPGSEATIAWSGAAAGQNNAITGYQVYRSETADGTYTLLETVTTTESSGSAAVTAPTADGVTYYYKVRTVGTLSGSDSDLSSAYAALSCTYSSPSAPGSLRAGGNQAAFYARPGESVVLSWSGASAGANNPVTGYDIYRNGEILDTVQDPGATSYVTGAPDQAGGAYTYTVVTRGQYASSAPSVGVTVYAYSEPTAPTTVSAAKTEVSAGARVHLSWSGAEPGAWNSITGYRIYRSTEVNGVAALVTSISTTATSGSVMVNAPGTKGGHYYFRVETMGSYNGSGVSTAYASVTATDDDNADDSEVTVYVLPQKRTKRGMVIGDYDTAEHGWTLTGLSFPEPGQLTEYITVPGRLKGPLDFSTAMTDGDPCYGSRPLTATFECSEGTRMEREALISEMVNSLHGMRLDGVLPDDPTHYITGRWAVVKEYSDLAHAAVKVTATCDPWRYSTHETQVEHQLMGDAVEIVLSNNGSCPVAPEVTVQGYDASVSITVGANTWNLAEGTHHLPALVIRHGNTPMTCSGFGTLIFKWREAIL